MKNDIDNIINEYIDGDLEEHKVEEFNRLISENPDALEKLKAHKITHAYLNELSPEPAPAKISERIMQKIGIAFTETLPKSYFFHAVMGFFLLVISASIISFFVLFFNTDVKSTNTEAVITSANNFITGIIGDLAGVIAGTDVMLVVSTLLLIIMLSFYFLFETHKTTKKRLHTISR